VPILGADRVVDYAADDFTDDEQTYDAVFDAVGKSTFGRRKRLLKPGGVYVSSDLGPWARSSTPTDTWRRDRRSARA
jgi:NADPH:quinone reductase-like Zn-dependent oxidoreductase